MNEILKEYYQKFDEFPFLLTTQSYNDDDYKTLMILAINRNEKLSKKEIVKYFKNNYDLVEIDFDPDEEDDYD